MEPAAVSEPASTPTLSPEAALIHYHRLYVEQPVQFTEHYIAAPAFRQAVNASGLALAMPHEAGGQPTLVRIPAQAMSYTVTEHDNRHDSVAWPSLATASTKPSKQREANYGVSHAQPEHHRHAPSSAPAINGFGPSTSRWAAQPAVHHISHDAAARMHPIYPYASSAAGGAGPYGPTAPPSEGDTGFAAPVHMIPAVQRLFENAPRDTQGQPMHSGGRALSEGTPTGDRCIDHNNVSETGATQVDELSLQIRGVTLESTGPRRAEAAVHGRQSKAPRSHTKVARARAQGTGTQRPRQAATPAPGRVSKRTDEPLPKVAPKMALGESDLARANTDAMAVFESVRPEENEAYRRSRLLAHMNKLVRSEWPNSSVRMFGSGANGLNMRHGDVDMCLMVPGNGSRNTPHEKITSGETRRDRKSARGEAESMTDKQIMRRMAAILKRSKMTDVQELLRARVPIVKVKDPVSGFSIDLCLNNELVHHNTDLLRTYVGLDARVQPLCLLIKLWAKRRCINETYRGTLSSYAYVLLLINFLQCRTPAILPCLQKMKQGACVGPDERGMVRTAYTNDVPPRACNVYFDRTVTSYPSENTESVVELLIGFMHYFAYTFKYSEEVVSPRSGRVISRRAKKWDRERVATLHAEAERRAQEKAEREFVETKELQRLERELDGSVPPAGDAPPTHVTDAIEVNDEEFPALGTTSTPAHKASASSAWQSPVAEKRPHGPGSAETPEALATLAHRAGPTEVPLLSQKEAEQPPAACAEEDEAVKAGLLEKWRKREARFVEQHCFCIEDPFDTTHDLGRIVDAETLEVIRHEFVRAHKILASSGDVHAMMEQWTE